MSRATLPAARRGFRIAAARCCRRPVPPCHPPSVLEFSAPGETPSLRAGAARVPRKGASSGACVPSAPASRHPHYPRDGARHLPVALHLGGQHFASGRCQFVHAPPPIIRREVNLAFDPAVELDRKSTR